LSSKKGEDERYGEVGEQCIDETGDRGDYCGGAVVYSGVARSAVRSEAFIKVTPYTRTQRDTEYAKILGRGYAPYQVEGGSWSNSPEMTTIYSAVVCVESDQRLLVLSGPLSPWNESEPNKW
jgi:hypothetical protein